MPGELLGGRVALTRTTGALVVGDLAMIGVFVVAGEATHGGTVAATVLTFIEFAAGWIVVAPLVGAYAADAVASYGRAGALVLGAWIAASLLGQVIRATVEPAASMAPTFVIVTLVIGGALLLVWRVVAAAILPTPPA